MLLKSGHTLRALPVPWVSGHSSQRLLCPAANGWRVLFLCSPTSPQQEAGGGWGRQQICSYDFKLVAHFPEESCWWSDLNGWHVPWRATPLAPDTIFPRVGPTGSCLASWYKLGRLAHCILDTWLLPSPDSCVIISAPFWSLYL